MTFEYWLAYVATVLVFMSTPGPSHLLMLSNSLANGFARSTATASGDLCANFLQMLAATLGLVTIIQASQSFFVAVKWAGVVYLIYLGIRMIRRGTVQRPETEAETSIKVLYWQGFVTSAANPKAVVFFAALFPQFLDLSRPALSQFVVLSFTYLAIDGIFLLFYGKTADILARKLKSHWQKTMNRLSGGLLIVAAVLLGLKDVNPR